jgi:PAS domain S-box-containing protein
VLARCLVSLLAIATAALLALKNLSFTARMREQIEMLNLTHDAIVVHNMNGIITFWNRGAEALYGWSADEAVGQHVHTLTQTEFSTPLVRIEAELRRTGRWDGEIQRKHRNGTTVCIAGRWALWRDRTGKPIATVATNNDITERKQAEAALARSEEFLAEAQRLSKTGSIGLRMPSGEVTWSAEAYRIFEMKGDARPTLDEMIERTHPDDVPRLLAAIGEACRGEPRIDVAYRLLLAEGSVKHLHLVARRTTASPDQAEYVGALKDVTDAVITQDALQRSLSELAHVARVSTLGELAASIAHEVTQPLAAIVTCGDSALRWLNRPHAEVAEAQQSIEQMIRDARRASDVIRQIRAMAQKRDPVHVMLDMNAVVREAVDLVTREIQSQRVEAHIALTLDALPVYADNVQLQQVLINLLVNAVQAMSSVSGRRRELWVDTTLVNDCARVTVRDAGHGFAEGAVDKVFNPFYTTKADGMGMGLSICRSIIEGHGGRIWAESPPEGGAALIVELGLHAQEGATSVDPDGMGRAAAHAVR